MAADIREFVFETPLFDDHEHFCTLPMLDEDEDSYFSFVGYARADLEVALGPGRPGQTPFPAKRGPEFDEVFFSAWKKSRNTGYCRAIEQACRDLLGVEYQQQNVELISQRLKGLKGDDAAGLFKHALQDRAGIKWAIKDSINMPDQATDELYPPFVHLNYRDDWLLSMPNRDAIIERENRWKRNIYSLDDLVDGLMKSISDCIATGRVTAFKIGLAYTRDLDFAPYSKADAERVFNRMMHISAGEKVLRIDERIGGTESSPAIPQLSGKELRPLHDYLVHLYVQRASDEGKPVQIHTGYLAGLYRDLRNINPLQLVPLFIRYRNTTFDLFHAGWPYTDELGIIAKNYPHVWISLCWAWTMNPITMARALDAWLDCVPYNKIIGFGGDTLHPIASYGYAMQAREGIARVLEQRIDRGDMDTALAHEAARGILYTNGCALHNLPQ